MKAVVTCATHAWWQMASSSMRVTGLICVIFRMRSFTALEVDGRSGNWTSRNMTYKHNWSFGEALSMIVISKIALPMTKQV